MIAAIEWVPAGVAKQHPLKYEVYDKDADPVESTLPAKKQVENSSGLPADLRMDEYSDDEDDGAAVGNLLVGNEEEEEVEQKEYKDEDYDSEDDDLEDVPDTREFTPIDVAGLEAMGIGDGPLLGMGGDEEDESEAEDVMISPDDAVVVVAKAEDVRLCTN